MATPDKKRLTYSHGSDEDYSIVCLPCYREELTLPACGYCLDCKEHLCYNCYQHHKKATPCRHHKLLDKANMPSTQQLTDGIPEQADPTDKLTTPCSRHQGETIKLFCHTHNVVLCSVCVTLDHTKPCHVHYIPNIAKTMINSQAYKDTIDGTDKLLKKCTTIKTKTTKDTNKSNDSLETALLDLRKHRQEINETLDELQKDIEDKIESLRHQNEEKMKREATLCDDVRNKVQAMHDNIEELNTTKQANNLFLQVKQSQTQLLEFDRCILSIPTDSITEEYKYIPNQAIDKVLQKEKTIGDISTKSPRKKLPMAWPHITPKHQGEVCVKAANDGVRCWIADMVALPPDRLILTDWLHNSIKLVDIKSKSITSQLSLVADRPSNITAITRTQVAVTVPSRQHILLVTVSNKLSSSHTVLTDGACCAICCHRNQLIVTYKNPGKLEILNMKGKVITKLTTDTSGTAMFMEPEYVQANSGAIYVSDDGYNEVIMLNWQGEILRRCMVMKSPTGLALLTDGSLLVCDFARHRLLQISGDCTHSKMVLQDVRFPLAVCVDDGGHKLYISRGTGTDVTDNNIQLYNIQ